MTLPVDQDWLGIDFGTCYSSAAQLVDGRPQPIKEPLRHGYSVPSSVFLPPGDDAGLVVGIAAENQKMLHPDRFRSQFKRELGRQEPIPLGGRHFAVDELVAAVLSYLREQGTLATGRAPAGAVVTVPASYEAHLRERMEAAARLAGFAHVELLEEPVAAIVEHASHTTLTGTVLVYDLGGGTCDVAVVEVTDGGPRVIGYDGVPDIGGVNFDHAIERDLAERGGEALARALAGLDSDDAELRMAALRTQLMARDECVRIKHDLSGLVVSATSFVVPTGVVSYELTRDRLAGLVAADVRRTIECCERLLESTGIAWADLEGILMVGGSCRLPFIGDMLAEASSVRQLWRVGDPELAVCAGAAVRAGRAAEPPRTELVVDPAGGGDHVTIAEAAAAAAPGTTIRLRAGIYREPVVLEHPVAVAGDGFRSKIVLEGDGDGPVVTLAHSGARLEGLTIRAATGPAVVVAAGGPEVADCDVEVKDGPAIAAAGDVELLVRGSRLAGDSGVSVLEGARARLSHNLVIGATACGVGASGAGTEVTLRGDRIVDGSGSALAIDGGAQATLEACELVRHQRTLVWAGPGADVSLIGCHVADGHADGVSAEGAAVRLEDSVIAGHAGRGVVVTGAGTAVLRSNELRGNRLAGVDVIGADAAAELHENVIADQAEGAGVSVRDGAAALVARNEIAHNGGPGLRADGSPELVATGNRIEGNAGDGVDASTTSGRVEGNLVTGNGGAAVRFGAPATGTPLRVDGNMLRGNHRGAIAGELPDAGLGRNELGFPDGYPPIAATLAGALEHGEVLTADRICIDAVRAAAGNGRVDGQRLAGAIPPDLLRWLDAVWLQATGIGLRGRPWVRESSHGVTTKTLGGTHLEKRLAQIGL